MIPNKLDAMLLPIDKAIRIIPIKARFPRLFLKICVLVVRISLIVVSVGLISDETFGSTLSKSPEGAAYGLKDGSVLSADEGVADEGVADEGVADGISPCLEQSGQMACLPSDPSGTRSRFPHCGQSNSIGIFEIP